MSAAASAAALLVTLLVPAGAAAGPAAARETPAAGAVPTYVVTTLADTYDGSCDVNGCSLREALILSSGDPLTPDTITFSVTGTIELTSELPYVTNVTIQGPGADLLTIQRAAAAPAFRIFYVPSEYALAISGLTIKGGSTNVGGGILNAGTVAVTDCTIAENYSSLSGGGIDNRGTATVTNSTIRGNSSSGPTYLDGYGAGIYNAPGKTLTVTGSTISGNGSRFHGGGIHNQGGSVTVTNSTISANGTSYSGGGIFTQGGGSTAVTNSTISGNSASSGGGIFVYFSSSATLTNCTITRNSAYFYGGGAEPYGGSITMRGSILAGNSGNLYGLGGGEEDLIVFSGGSFNNAGFNSMYGNPKLGPLAENGGPTKTHALLQGSPALDQGSSFDLTTDQRGLGRPYDAPATTNATDGDGSDIGAFEVQPPSAAPVAVCQDVTVDACHAGVTAAQVNNGSSDPDGGALALTLDPAGPYPVGQTLVTLHVVDNTLVESTCEATITVTAGEALVCPSAPAPVATGPGSCTAAVTYSAPASACGTVTCLPASGSQFPVGVTSVTCSSTGGGSCAFDVTVTDGFAAQVGSVAGPAAAAAGDSTTSVYSVASVADVTYLWSVPTGATIVSGQGTNSIGVQFGPTSGSVSVLASRACGSVSPSTAVTVSGFNWAFDGTGTPIGWAGAAADVGTWAQDSGSFASLSGAFAGGTTIYDSTFYDTPYGDFTYETEISRTGCSTCSNTVMVRGVPSPYVGTAKQWQGGYLFSIARTGRFGVWRLNGASAQTLQAWATPVGASAINTAEGAPNRLRVVASGGTLSFYVNYDAATNPNPVFVVNSVPVLSGRVGVGMVRTGAATLEDDFRASWSQLIPTAAARGAGRGAVTRAQAAANKRATREGNTNPLRAPER